MHRVKLLLVMVLMNGLLVGCAKDIDKRLLIEKYSNQDSEFLPLNNMNVHYRDQGVGEVILLLHGTASSLHTWDQWSLRLENNYRVIRLDLPGFGLTGPQPLDQYEVVDDVEFLHGFVQKLGIEKVHLVGSSLGGRIGWQYSLQYPQQVKSLTLINALGYPQESWPPAIEMAQWPILDSLVAQVSPRFMFESGLKEIYYNEDLVDNDLVDRYYELAHYPGNMDAFPKRVKAKLDNRSLDIQNIDVPTLILWGEEDRYFPLTRAFDFKRDIRRSSLVTYKGVGHLPMEEVADKSVADFRAFLQRL